MTSIILKFFPFFFFFLGGQTETGLDGDEDYEEGAGYGEEDGEEDGSDLSDDETEMVVLDPDHVSLQIF